MRLRRTQVAIAAAVAVAGARAGAARRKAIKIGGLATLEGPFAASGAGRHARRRAGAQGAQRHGRRQQDRAGQGAPPTPSPTRRRCRAQADRAGQGRRSWSARSRAPRASRSRTTAKTKPEITFINGSSAAQDTTLRNPSPNFFRFNSDGAQWMVGLGEHAFKTRAGRRSRRSPRTIRSRTRRSRASWPSTARRRQDHRQVLGPARHQGLRLGDRRAAPGRRRPLRRARRGGRGQLPQPVSAGGRHKPMIGGSITVDQDDAQLQGQARAKRCWARRRPARSPIPATTPDWKKFVAATRRTSRTASRRRRCSPKLLHHHEGGARWAGRGQGRPLERPGRSTARRSPS